MLNIKIYKIALFTAAALAGLAPFTGASADSATFKAHVQPILAKYCLECHVPGKQGFEKSGLDMSSYESLMKGTKYGPVVIPGDAFTSNLMVLIEGRADISLKMPHNREGLKRREMLILRQWINRGARNN